MPEPIIVSHKKTGDIIYAFGALCFVLIGIVFLTVPSLSVQLAGLLSIAFFGFCLVMYIKRIFRTHPLLIIDEQGITDHSSALAIGFIPWKDIENIEIRHMFNQIFISVEVTSHEAYLAKMTPLQRHATKANLKMGYPLVNITLNTTGTNPQTIHQRIKEDFGHYYRKD
ncbi:STM3941 family protein [Streptococcus halotolerans]|uniref:STM3941 family protein n=1 Tax=Streptococcus halotolerans TaxID=1814128 RepID=UPI00078825F1|nr:STM3941 family protein [Streptococcus halotolerans]